MSTFKERLEEALKSSGLSAADLSRITGINEGAISQYRKGAYKASQPTLEKLAKALSVSIPWLMGVDDNDGFPSGFPAPRITEDTVTFPVIGEIAAGYEYPALEDWSGETVEIPRHYLRGRACTDYIVLTVHGDSMYPMYLDGDKVLVLKQDTLSRSGEIGLVIYDGDNATMKKVEYVDGEDWMKLIPLNPEYAPKTITGADLETCRVIGVPRLLIREIHP